jgi:hypothetical protein
MVVWALTAGIGIYLLAVGFTAQRTDERAPRAPVKTEAPVAMGSAALTVVLGDERPTGSRPAPEGSPLLEFVHPALALLGLTFWICYTMTHYRPFAWIALGVVVATVLAGVSWEVARRRMTRRHAVAPDEGAPARGGTGFPPHLILLHGVAAACTFALVVIAAAAAR